MQDGLNIASTDNSRVRTVRASVFILLTLFLVFSILSQLLYSFSPTFSILTFVLSIAVVLIEVVIGTRNEMFIFLYFTTAMRILMPFTNQKEVDLILPTLFFVVGALRFSPKFAHIRRGYFHPLFCLIGLFFLICLITVFYGIKVPGINSTGTNSGLLSRFNLLNSVITFSATLILFDTDFINRWLRYFFRFYLGVFMISLVIVLFDIKPFPLFNSFTWSNVVENEGSKKMIIAGISALSVLIYTLLFVKRPLQLLLLIALSLVGMLLSGSRISFVAGVAMIAVTALARRRILGKSFVVLAVMMIVVTRLLLSPLILMVPERYQRLVVIFPPSYYKGELAEFASSAAAASTSFRFDLWTRAGKKIGEHPLLGNGYRAPLVKYDFSGASLEMYRKVPTERLHNDFVLTGNLHNTFISTAYALGIPAAILFGIFLFSLTVSHYQKSLVLTGPLRTISLFITVMLINYIIFALVSDLIFELEFFAFLAIALKVLVFHYKRPTNVLIPNKNSV